MPGLHAARRMLAADMDDAVRVYNMLSALASIVLQ